MKDFIKIDGSQGEGGGQMLRSSLALSLISGRPFKMDNIRSKRRKPGLMRQHLTAVRAAAEVGHAVVEGDEIGSCSLSFVPGEVHGGDYHFSVGTAGSAILVMQTILPPLLLAAKKSTLRFDGGTHNMMAPPYDFISRCFIPQLEKTGVKLSSKLTSWGFYPAGGGSFTLEVTPVSKLQGFELECRGELLSKKAKAIVSSLSKSIANRELRKIKQELGWSQDQLEVVQIEDSKGPGNVILFELEYKNITELITAFGERGVEATKVAANGIARVREYLSSDAPTGEYLTDQLLIPLALAGVGRLVCTQLSSHTLTNIEVIKMFLDVKIETQCLPSGSFEIIFGT